METRYQLQFCKEKLDFGRQTDEPMFLETPIVFIQDLFIHSYNFIYQSIF